MTFTLQQILSLVGTLDDSPGDDTPRERFRRYLKENVHRGDMIRDYIYECWEHEDEQHRRAFRDLVNFLGQGFLHFHVESGPYQGDRPRGDGWWKSPTGVELVVEIAGPGMDDREVASLTALRNGLVGRGEVAENAWALLVGTTGEELGESPLANRLRVASVESLLTLVDLVCDYDIPHREVVQILIPQSPYLDSIARSISQIAAVHHCRATVGDEEKRPNFWITSVEGREESTSQEVVESLVNGEKMYALGEKSPARTEIQPNDWICFYLAGIGVVAHAQVASKPEKLDHPKISDPIRQGWIYYLDKPQFYYDEPVIIDGALRHQLTSLSDDDGPSWAWAVKSTTGLTRDDFELLTRGEIE